MHVIKISHTVVFLSIQLFSGQKSLAFSSDTSSAYPVATRRTLKPDFDVLELEWNFRVIVSALDFRLKFLGMLEPQSQVFVYLAILPTKR